ncbi:kinesin-like protein KIF9 [Tribolium madens]|uniref:kinesin-like protein KIF9 n=1 Tax=Tribolium madens TaxID=41895 RepID=UPI001CF739BB|nr:kinesin-like protein KIF9 [Tribolium madens]
MVEKKYTKIYFRLLPTEKMAWNYLKILDDHKTIYIRCLQELNKTKEAVPTFWTFHADQVFFNHTQKEIYDTITPDVLDNLSNGRDAVIMAYGQTGTGKSLTINGLQNPFENRGILPRVISDLFQNLNKEASKNIKMCIQASYVEFSRTNIYDLLQPYPNLLNSLKEITKVKIRSEEEALKIIFRGEGRKVFAESASYPSHSSSSIFTFYINKKNLEMQDNPIRKSKLHIVDLAGADTVGNFSCSFKNPYEIGSANLAKTQLEQFFLVLCSQIPEQIKLRQKINPMIQYLGDSLNNASILRLIGHIRASREDLLVTISMLRFGEIIGGLKSMKCEISVNKEVTQERVESLERELRRLKLENTYNSILMHQDLAKSLNEERFAHIERTVNEFLQNKISHLALLNVCDVNIALEILKMIYKKSEEERGKEQVMIVTKHSGTSSHKAHSKSSRLSHKTSSTETLPKEKTRSGSAVAALKTSSKLGSLRETGSKTKSRTSSSSLVKRPSTNKRKSSSSASLYDKNREKSKSKQSFESVLMPQIPPEYHEAWHAYITDKNDEFTRFQHFYEKNEAAAKNMYKTYLNDLDRLREISSNVEKHKHDLFLARMTREFQRANIDKGETISEFEKCSTNRLQTLQQEQLEVQESVLRSQTELKTYINACKDIKKDVRRHFDLFCKEKYNLEISGLEPCEPTTMDIVATLDKEKEKIVKEVQPEDTHEMNEIKRFERFKNLIEYEKRRKRLYQIKHREWVIY